MRLIAILAAGAAFAAGAQGVPQFTDITPTGANVTQVVLHPLEAGRLLAASRDGVRLSSDGGATWSAPNRPWETTGWDAVDRVFAHPGRPGVVFMQLQGVRHLLGPGIVLGFGGGTFRSTDFGTTWSVVAPPYAGPDDTGISPFASDPVTPEHLYASVRSPLACGFDCEYPSLSGDKSVLESLDGGLSWTPANAGLPATAGQWGVNAVEGPVPAARGRLFFTTLDARAFISEDGGHAWKAFTPPALANVGWIKQDPLRANVLYAWANLIDRTGRSQILRSEDAGVTWTRIFDIDSRVDFGIYLSPNLAIDPSAKGRLWLAGVGGGLFLSEDDGKTWTNVPFDSQLLVDHEGNYYPWTGAAIVPSPTDRTQVYVVHDGHLYRGDLAPRSRVAVEYSSGERFWITGDAAEAHSQDYRGEDALRSGSRFGLWSPLTAPAGAIGICRFQGNPAFGQHSRFIALEGAECEAVNGSPAWVLEARDELFAMPPAAGNCGAGTVAVTRFYNGKADDNHRYVTDATVATEMRARGWIDEGVVMCARQLEDNEGGDGIQAKAGTTAMTASRTASYAGMHRYSPLCSGTGQSLSFPQYTGHVPFTYVTL